MTDIPVFNENLLPILTSAEMGVWVCDAVDGKVELKNDYFGLLGLSLPEAALSSLSDMQSLFHPGDASLIDEAVKAAAMGKSTTVTCRTLDETLLESSFVPAPGGVAVLSVNKGKMMKAQSWKSRYRTLVDTLFPNFIFVFDANFIFVDVITPDGLRLFHKKEELIGMDAHNLYSPEVSELFVANIRESLKTNHWREIEYHLDLLGIRYYYQARIVPVDGDKAFCLIQDIGDRVRRLEEILTQRKRAEESDRMKSVFLTGISHEIRTPLNAIVGFSELLMNEDTPEIREEYIEMIRCNNDMLLQTINDILDLSRLEAGMSEFTFEETDITGLMREVYSHYLPNVKPGVRLLCDIPDETIQVPTDAGRLKQLLGNFLSNAIKYTTRGSITLKLEKGDDFLIFSVSDTGCGIPADKLEAIFRRFEKLNNFAQGTGLGLSISKTIVERLGGNITTVSKLNEGSVFSFTIPYRYAAPGKENIGSMRELAANQRKRILVVEPSAGDIELICETLKPKYDMVVVTEEDKITSSFILEHPNLVLMSMEMAGKQDVVRKIHNISPSIPIIAMTTSDFYHDMRWAIENGCTDVIPKPFSGRKLEEVVSAFIV